MFDAGNDAGEFDAGPTDAGSTDAGTTPFSLILYPSLTTTRSPLPFDVPESRQLQIFFPQGRHGGAPFVVSTVTDGSRVTINTQAGMLGTNGDATIYLCGSALNGDICTLFTGTLVGPDDGIQGHLQQTYGCGSDTLDTADFDGWWRPNGDEVPAGHLKLEPTAIAPSSQLTYTSPVPIDLSRSPSLAVSSGGVPIAGASGANYTTAGWIAFKPTTVFPPNGVLDVTATDLVDVLGRPIIVDASVTPLQTTASITDFTLQTEPPVGAMVYASWITEWNSTKRNIRVDGSAEMPWVSSALISLGDPQGATKAQIAWIPNFSLIGGPSSSSTTLTLVTQDGAAVDVPPAQWEPMTRTYIPVVVKLPGPGPVWLSFVGSPPSLWYGGWTDDLAVVTEIEFVP